MSHDTVGRVCELWYSGCGAVSCGSGDCGPVSCGSGGCGPVSCGTMAMVLGAVMHCHCGSSPVNLKVMAKDRSRPAWLELARGEKD